MKKSKLNLINDNLIWNASRRYKINSVVQYNDVDYQNITGLNSVPDLLIDWQTSSDGVSDLNGLSDVTITGTTANKILGSTTEGIWENKTIAQILGYTAENFANKQNSLTIDGTGVKYPTVDAVNAGLVLKSNIASPTFTGTPSAPTATVGTNTTQLATTAFVLANANSNALLLSGNQSFTGTKTGISSTGTPTVFNLTNNNTTTGSYLIDLINSSASSSNSSGAIRANNNNSDPSTSAAQINSNSSGMAVFVGNLSTGIGYRGANWDTGILAFFDSKAGSTGDLIQFAKAGSVTAKVDQNGNFSVQSITVLGTLGLRNVANTFTSTFTNTNTAGRTYTLPNRDITFAGIDEVVLKTTDQNILGVKSFMNTNNSTSNGGLQFINNGSGSGKSIEMDNNSGGRAISLTNTSGVGFFGYNVSPNILYYCDNISVGDAANFRNNSSGRAIYIENKSTGKAIDIESTTASTGNILNITKNGTLVLKIDSNGELTAPKITMNGTIELKAYTVATLPTGVDGAVAYCTDLLAPTVMSTAVGGGSVKWKVFYDGTSWKVG